jgi:hypothetical protein
MTPEQKRRNDLQADWLISAMRKMDEPRAYKLDGESLRSPVDVIVGYLVTLPDGYECRMPADKTRAELYAAKNHATIEPMYVRRGG